LSGPRSGPRWAREATAAALFFLVATILMTWPLLPRLSDGMPDLWDAKLNARILQWDYAQTFRDPLDLFQLDFFHPARYVLAFSENLFGVSLFGFPLYAAGVSPLAAYNTLFLLGMWASALSAWALARYVTGDPLASVVAGFVYAFVPWRFSQIPHIQFQWGAFLCLLLLFLLRYLDTGRRREAVLFGACFGWNALCNVHYALFSGFLVAVVLLVEALGNGPDRARRIRMAGLAAIVGGLAFLPFALSYRKASLLYGMQRYMGELNAFSGRWSDFLSAGQRNRLYGALTARWRAPEGDLFPGLAALFLAGVAVVKLWRPRAVARGEQSPPVPVSRARHGAARALDLLIGILLVLWIASLARPGLSVGPLHLGDPGRVQVFLTAAVVLRLAAAFPLRAARRNLSDLLIRSRLEGRAVLFLAIAAVGVVVALGSHTPYYRFLFQSFGDLFRAIRSPARGIVLFHISLGVLAAWGLSLWTRGWSAVRRFSAAAAALLLVGIEYRAFPLRVEPVDGKPAAVYRWLKSMPAGTVAVEWPLGFTYDFDYVFEQASHGRPLVNGTSGFFPKPYRELQEILNRRPIPAEVWSRMRGVGAQALVYHSHDRRGIQPFAYARALRQAMDGKEAEILASFPHAGGRDFVFHLSGDPAFAVPGANAREAAREFDRVFREQEADQASVEPPFGGIHLPEEGQHVSPGFWAFGWALDDSGIAEIRVSTELGPAGKAMLGRPWPGLESVYPTYPGSRHGGFGFPIPNLPPGPHELRVTFVGKDGGTTVVTRRIVVEYAERPRGPGKGDAPGPVPAEKAGRPDQARHGL
jgi:hypothetical protein